MYFYLEHFGKGEKGGHGTTSAIYSGSGKCSGWFEEERFTLKMVIVSKRFFFSSLNTMHKHVPNFKPALRDLAMNYCICLGVTEIAKLIPWDPSKVPMELFCSICFQVIGS